METKTFTKEGWETETRRFYCVQNGFGHWWPKMQTLSPGMGGKNWYEVIIRDSTPFKTLNGAIKFIEKTRERICNRKQA